MLGRRSFLAASAGALTAASAASQQPQPVETHLHLFDPARFPYHKDATYKPEPLRLEEYLPEAAKIGLSHAVIVHPEPYQDDHSYLEYCFAHEPRKGFFKGTCLFDVLGQETPWQMKRLVDKWKGRIVALRIHAVTRQTELTGPIRNRPLDHPRVDAVWKTAGKSKVAIQLQTIPCWAPQIRKLAEENSNVNVVIDHLGRRNDGTAEEYEQILALGKLPSVYMKFSALNYSSKEPAPHRDLAQVVKRVYDAYTPERIIWGGLGKNAAEFAKQKEVFDTLLGFATAAERAAIAGGNAARLYRLA